MCGDKQPNNYNRQNRQKIHYAQGPGPPENNGQGRRPTKRTPEYKDEIQEGNTRKMINEGYIQITTHPYMLKKYKNTETKKEGQKP